ncbi:topoisomerase DNA-binding C4 zinc finger domain-containing protein [Bacillus gobiensis]|uniref:topoisomerase DNA-binding C4 zinc finger domain-containing protein n=1 Tax=Bacillus gobiensis TaxID=1441095 RepID=UPI003D2076B3
MRFDKNMSRAGFTTIKLSFSSLQKLFSFLFKEKISTLSPLHSAIRQVLMQSKNGHFFGCSNYPKCKYTENVANV